MNEHDDPQLADWMALGPQQGAQDALDSALEKARSTRRRPAWIVRLNGDTFQELPGVGLTSYAMVVLAVVLLTGIVIGSVVVGSALAPRPVPSVLAIASAGPSPSEPSTTTPSDLVAYVTVESLEPGQGSCVRVSLTTFGCTVTRAWLANADGSNALPILPDDQGNQLVMGWSADGSRLLVQEDTYLVVADATGSELARFTIWGTCKDGTCPDPGPYLCTYPCAGTDGYALSPDGTRVAFVRTYSDLDNATVVAVLDLGAGSVSELTSTRTTNGSERCWEDPSCQGFDDAPRWSPDGRRIAFARQVMSPEPGDTWTGAALLVVDADGHNLRRVTPAGTNAIDPSWSSDGTRLAFVGSEYEVNADRTSVVAIRPDIYVTGVDGSDLQRLTNDGISARPDWTADGRIAFMRQLAAEESSGFEDWIMDVDGANQSRTGGTLAELTAAGCLRCIYPLSSDDPQSIYRAYWQPMP